RDHLLDELMLRDLDAERLPLLRVRGARVAARANQPGRAGRDREAALIEGEHRNLESFTRPADDVRLGHLEVGHLEPARVAGEDAPLLLHRAAREPVHGAFDDERGETRGIALALLLLIGPRDGEKVVGDVGERDPALFAVQDVPIAFLDRSRLHAADVAAGARLGESVAGDPLAL